jgi:hypothetical protein
LFWSTKVFAFELGVHDPLGAVLEDDEPPHDTAAAIAAAATRTPVTLLTFPMLFVSLFQTGLYDSSLYLAR